MDDLMTNQYVWAFLAVGGIIGVYVLSKVPELLVAVLLVGPEYVQFALRIMGFNVSRKTFAAAGAVVFFPIVLLFLVVRMLQAREKDPLIGRPNVPFVLIAVLLGLDLLIGLTYSDSQWQGAQKTRDYFLFGMAPAFLVFVFLRDRASVHRFLGWTLAITGSYVALSAGYAVIKGALPEAPEQTAVGMNIPAHLGLATAIVIAMAAAMAMAAGRAGKLWKVLPILALPFVAYFTMLSGTRSSLIALAFMATIGFYWIYKKQRGLLIGGAVIMALSVVALYLFGTEEIHERIFSSWIAAGTRHGYGGADRIDWLTRIPGFFFQAPVLGSGTGGWPILEFGIETYAWPHNMFAEILVENGLVGLIIVLGLWFVVFQRVVHCMRISDVGDEIYGFAVFGGCLLALELTNALAHFGIAHYSCSLLLTSAITMRSTFLVASSGAEGGPLGSSASSGEEVEALQAGPL